MTQASIDIRVVGERVDVIQTALKRLKQLQPLSIQSFMEPDTFAITEHHLRYAIEAVFDICSHILSRIPGSKAVEYKQMAAEMAVQKIVPEAFADDILVKMAGYRNRLTHFYFEISPKEMYGVIQNNLGDFETFLKHIKKYVNKRHLA